MVATMSLRCFTIFGIVFFFAVGSFMHLNFVYRAVHHVSNENRGPIFNAEGLNALHAFKEPSLGHIGYEIEVAKCAEPFGALPIPTASYYSTIPSQYRFRSGNFNILYLYNGAVYAPTLFSARMRLMYMINRIGAPFGAIDLKNTNYYFKLWYPRECPPLTERDIAELQNGLAAWTASN